MPTYLTDPRCLRRRCRPYFSREYGISQIPMLLQIADPAIDDRARCAQVFGAGTHETAIDGVGEAWRRGDEEDVVGRDGIDLRRIWRLDLCAFHKIGKEYIGRFLLV